MSSSNTSEIGIDLAMREIERRGGTNVAIAKNGNKKFILYDGIDGRRYSVLSRTRKKGTWQTSIRYGKQIVEIPLERELWLFVDLTVDPPRFFPVPSSWIANDIYENFQELLQNYGGSRKYNNNSTHHAIRLKRIEKWENQWARFSLADRV